MKFKEGDIAVQNRSFGIRHADEGQLVRIVRVAENSPSPYTVECLTFRREYQRMQGFYHLNDDCLDKLDVAAGDSREGTAA